jgi:hypothetical protein
VKGRNFVEGLLVWRAIGRNTGCHFSLISPWSRISRKSTLARLEAALNLVDHIDPALAADQTIVAVATAQRFQRVTDLHGTILML